MFISKQSSSFIDYIIADILRGTVSVYLKNSTGIQRYAFKNVSRRAIANLTLQPNMSLGFWVNNNCFNSLRAVAVWFVTISCPLFTLTMFHVIYDDGSHSFTLDEFESLNDAESSFKQHVSEHDGEPGFFEIWTVDDDGDWVEPIRYHSFE